MDGRSILLIVGGGIAAYKAPDLVRQFRKAGLAVRVILTDGGAQFVSPLALASVSGTEVHQSLFDLTAEAKMGHIELSRSADLVVVAPATADLMAKAAHGLANDLASTALLATDKPVLMAPAMNVRMWEHPATRRNHATLAGDGIAFVGPDAGEMACGEVGAGRMTEPAGIVAAALALLGPAADPPTPRGEPPGTAGTGDGRRARTALSGIHALLTAGPTVEPIDPVRFVSNRSSGKQGYALADALARAGARVTLVSGPTALPAPAGVRLVRVETARDMLAACQAALPADVFLAVAAVADWRPEHPAAGKLKLKDTGSSQVSLEMVQNPDILATVAQGRNRPGLVIGFAAETQAVAAYATAKRARKGADWVIANDVSGDVMGGDHNEAMIVTSAGIEPLARMGKDQLATLLVNRIAAHLGRA